MAANPSTGSEQSAKVPLTILSTIQPFTARDVLQTSVDRWHGRFTASHDESAETLTALNAAGFDLLDTFGVLSSIPITNPKLVSILRQQTAISNALHLSEQNVRQIIEALRRRSGARYGEDIPLDRTAVMAWAVSRLESWGNSVGMETFKEDFERENKMTVVLGGKVLVLDIDFSVDRSDPTKPRIDVKTLKTSYAVQGGTNDGSTSANMEGSASLDALLAGSIREFLIEVQKDLEEQDALEAERLGKVVAEYLKYLMMLDKLAAKKEENGGGIRWFADMDKLGAGVEQFAASEANIIASNLSLRSVPLDIFLRRAHALPLPYLTSPSITFLVHLSPLAYLSILRTAPSISPPSPSHLPKLDIPLVHIREHLCAHPQPAGVTTATLILEPSPYTERIAAYMEVNNGESEWPTFPLCQPEAQPTFPRILLPPQNSPPPPDEIFSWILDFTSSGKYPGVVMSQSRIREVESIMIPLDPRPVNVFDMNASGRRSWVDLLLNPGSQPAPLTERYTATYQSPSSAHPPLQLRLTAPDEQGYLLERVRVKTMKEIWGILEVVKEQCWLNDTLKACEWRLQSSVSSGPTVDQTDSHASEDLLQSLLAGTHKPSMIPVEVIVPSSLPTFTTRDLSYGPPSPTRHPRKPSKLTMSFPERPPFSGLVEIIVAYDQTRPNGVQVEIGSGMGIVMGSQGSGVEWEVLEQVCRRGGTLGLAGRVWKSASTD